MDSWSHEYEDVLDDVFGTEEDSQGGMFGSDWGPLSSTLNGLDLNGGQHGRWSFDDGDESEMGSDVSSIATMGELGEDARLRAELSSEDEDGDEDEEERRDQDGEDEDFSRGEEEEGKEGNGKVDENTNNWVVSRQLPLLLSCETRQMLIISSSPSLFLTFPSTCPRPLFSPCLAHPPSTAVGPPPVAPPFVQSSTGTALTGLSLTRFRSRTKKSWDRCRKGQEGWVGRVSTRLSSCLGSEEGCAGGGREDAGRGEERRCCAQLS